MTPMKQKSSDGKIVKHEIMIYLHCKLFSKLSTDFQFISNCFFFIFQFRTDNTKDISDGISTCANCLRYKIQQNLRPGLPISLVVIVLCAYLYIRCAITLKKSTITRKGLLTKAFAAILFFWIVMVLPHVIFIDFWMKGGFFCIF